jgi:hypothetical protein
VSPRGLVAEVLQLRDSRGVVDRESACRVVRIAGRAAVEDVMKLLRDLGAGGLNLRRVVYNRKGEYLVDIEAPELVKIGLLAELN